MGEISQDIIFGECCFLCGVYFVEGHGFPVVCHDCYNDLSEEEKVGQKLAVNDEL